MTPARAYAQIQKQHETPVRNIEDYMGLVKRIAYHLKGRLPSSVQVDDLIQSGMIGLLEAMQKYDASQGASFETYAGIRIRGAMLDEIRKGDWTPRSVHRKSREVSEAVRIVEARTGREARDEEVAAELGVDLETYHQTLQDSVTTQVLSIDTPDNEDLSEDQLSLQDAADDAEPMQDLMQSQFQQHLAAAIASLPEREQLVMSLYYDEELNLKEIGEVLGVSESRVCQIHGQALVRVRARLKDWIE
jgi:RNA polymerase sigma factor for flagellar operon FliA